MMTTSESVPIPAGGAEDEVRALLPLSNKILVIGGPRVGKKFILQRLSQSSAPLALSPVSLPTSPSSSVSLHTLHWPIDTRYYTASLHFHILNDADIPPFSPASLASLLDSPLLSELQGVLLVYDAGEESSLEEMKRWGSVVSQVNDEDSVMLLVGVERELGKAVEDVWEKARDWAIDHSIEHVRLRYDDARPAQPAGEDEEDDEGVRRIAGALEANRWQHMSLKDRAAAARERLLHDDDPEHPLSINARLAEEEQQAEAELDAHLQAEAEADALMEHERARLRHELQLEGAQLYEDDDALVDSEGKTFEERTREDEAVESQLGSFEALFMRIQQVRQEAVRAHGLAAAAASGSSISDAERRSRAEDAILSMLKSMGLDEAAEDDDDDQDHASGA